MAPKVPSRPQSSKQKLEKPVSSSSSEQEEESDEEIKDPVSDPLASEEEDEEDDLSGETRQDEDKKIGESQIDSENVYQGNGSDFGSDSESDLGSPSKYKLQPISKASKPSSSKRTHQEEGDGSVRNNKRSKTGSIPSGCITRLWSDDDEVTVLNGMIDFKNAKGLDPNTNIGPFHDFIKGNLGADFSREQLRTKIRRLKKRFSNAMKKCENGEDPVFSKPHEDKTFELSKKIWGSLVSKNDKEKTKKSVVKVNKVESEEKESVKKEKTVETKGDFRTKYPCLSSSFDNVRLNIPSLDMSVGGVGFVLKKLSSIGDDKAKELDEKWKQLIADEVQLTHKKLELMKEQIEMAFPKGE